jgi:hypothetical protein
VWGSMVHSEEPPSYGMTQSMAAMHCRDVTGSAGIADWIVAAAMTIFIADSLLFCVRLMYCFSVLPELQIALARECVMSHQPRSLLHLQHTSGQVIRGIESTQFFMRKSQSA